MPRIAGVSTPKYRKHRSTGQAVVTICGRDHYLVLRHKGSRVEYDRLIGEWLAAGRQLPRTTFDRTVTEILARFWEFAEQHYRKGECADRRTRKRSLRIGALAARYGEILATDFGPLALKTVREDMLASGLCRNVINQRVGIIKRVFRWASSEELVPVTVHQALATVMGLQRGRTKCGNHGRLNLVAQADDPSDPPSSAGRGCRHVCFQRLTGCRPHEACEVRPGDIDCSDEVWIYRPDSHKMEHRGIDRQILIGPQAQAVLRPYLLREETQFCFSPAESEAQQRAELRQPAEQGPAESVQPQKATAETATRITLHNHRVLLCRAACRG